METKEIKEILSEIGITEKDCTMLIDTGYSEHNIGYYPELVESIQKFTSYLERQKQAKLLMALATVREYPSQFKEPSIEYLDYLFNENKRLMEENEKLKEKINNSEIVYTGGCDAANGNVSIIKTIT